MHHCTAAILKNAPLPLSVDTKHIQVAYNLLDVLHRG